ncbi:hypothetical protein [Metabacillus arenae]|uniref:Uncharacterized protein n=1 Tax=Metabacillus arenae TaxID=2771434 RepID=A0A926NCL4_9BACI|nr:hypothetical protein [Metabacillus arenae]MBD1379074.1 hypothetical protein [Metabacillus arenae]
MVKTGATDEGKQLIRDSAEKAKLKLYELEEYLVNEVTFTDPGKYGKVDEYLTKVSLLLREIDENTYLI